PRPRRRELGVVLELCEVDPADDAEIVVPDEADVASLSRDCAAAVRPRPVADDVAEAPDRVDVRPFDRLERSREGVEVTVDVGDDRDAQWDPSRSETTEPGRNVTRGRRRLARGSVPPRSNDRPRVPHERARRPSVLLV